MVSYSHWLAQHPLVTHETFTTHVRRVFGPAVRDRSGEIVKTTGDGVVAIFRHPGDAEGCARDIQSRFETAPPATGAEPRLRYRIAVHYGDIIVEPDDLCGIDVNVAIHMQALAPPGGICLSGAAFFRLEEHQRALYEYVGRKHVKNVGEPLDIYLLIQDFASLGQLWRDARPPDIRRNLLNPPPRLGVAEFQTYAERDAQLAIGKFVQDTLQHGLSRFRDIFVVSPIRAKVSEQGSDTPPARDNLSSEMGLEYLAHGSCLAGKDSVTLVVNLEYLVRKELIWSTRLRIATKDIDLVHDKVMDECATPIALCLQRNEARSWSAVPHFEHEKSFRKAQKLMSRRTLTTLTDARDLLAAIIDRCGDIGDVYIALARAEHSLGLLQGGPRFVEALERARGLAQKAIEVDHLNPRAHGELALQELFLRRHMTAAEIYQHALQLNPYDPILRADWADYLVSVGRAGEALPILQKVAAAWPQDRTWVDWNLCDAYWALGQPDRIVDILHAQPDLPHVHRSLTASYAKLGRMREARQHAEQVRAHQPGFSAKEWSKVVLHTSDAADEFAECLELAGL